MLIRLISDNLFYSLKFFYSNFFFLKVGKNKNKELSFKFLYNLNIEYPSLFAINSSLKIKNASLLVILIYFLNSNGNGSNCTQVLDHRKINNTFKGYKLYFSSSVKKINIILNNVLYKPLSIIVSLNINTKKLTNILFLRKNKVFNKGRYSRNRQFYRTGVY